MFLARTMDAFGSARRRDSMRYGIATPAPSPTATPVNRRPTSSPGRSFQAASSPAAIIVTTAASITPRRPARAARELTPSSVAIAPTAKIAKTTVVMKAERPSHVRYSPYSGLGSVANAMTIRSANATAQNPETSRRPVTVGHRNHQTFVPPPTTTSMPVT